MHRLTVVTLIFALVASGCAGANQPLDTSDPPMARAATPPSMTIEWCTGDAYAWSKDQTPDLVISSLVTHHMDDAEIVRFLAWMEATARQGWFVNDLHRHWLRRLPFVTRYRSPLERPEASKHRDSFLPHRDQPRLRIAASSRSKQGP